MTVNKILTAFGILVIGMAITLHGYFTGNALRSSDAKESITPAAVIAHDKVFNLSEAAQYLRMSEEEVKGIIDLEKSELEEIGSFDGKMFPYFTVDGQQFFYKDQIDEWLNEVTVYHREYNIKDGWML